MVIELSQQLREQMARSGEAPVRITDATSKEEFVILPVVVYERMRRRLETEAIDASFYEFVEKDSQR